MNVSFSFSEFSFYFACCVNALPGLQENNLAVLCAMTTNRIYLSVKLWLDLITGIHVLHKFGSDTKPVLQNQISGCFANTRGVTANHCWGITS